MQIDAPETEKVEYNEFLPRNDRLSGWAKSYLDEHKEFVELAIKKDPALPREFDDARDMLSLYPGVIALAAHEHAHNLYLEGKKFEQVGDGRAKLKFLLARAIAESAHERTGIDIHPGTQIGENFFIDHGTGDIIGETAKIGKNTLLHHNVTLGAYGHAEKEHRHPEIGNKCLVSVGVRVLGHVVIGNKVKIEPGATLTGNNITVSDGVKIGTNAQIGEDNHIAEGKTIGMGAIIPDGMGQINRDIPPYSIVSKDDEGKLVIKDRPYVPINVAPDTYLGTLQSEANGLGSGKVITR